MSEIQQHPWMMKGFDARPTSFIPRREPLHLPLDTEVVSKMAEFGFGSPDQITQELESTLRSEDYRQWGLTFGYHLAAQTSKPERKCKVFGFFKRWSDVSLTSSTELREVYDPPCSPLISIYYLVREKLERERQAL